MALVATSKRVPRGDPTLSLVQALTDFKQILTDEEMRQYKANATTPGASSIIEFVRIVDESKSETTMRCMGSRLCTFLDKTQQFAGIADTFVSSNPSIAALVWGSVKMAILTANNVGSYFEKVTNLIMSIGKLCPSYEKFGGLYPGCIELQNELCDFYAIIIRMCIKIIEVSRRQTAKQMISSFFSPFESDFKPFLELLEKSEKNVAREIQFASLKANQDAIKLQEFESKKSARFRLDFYKTSRKQDDEANEWRIAKLKRDSERLRSRIRKNLSSIDHLTPWKQAIRERVSGTAEWLCLDDTFSQWKRSTGNTTLWCSGAMGVGKTVLTSNVVSQLHGSRNANEIISHHFCCADNKDTLSARNIMGGLACQLLETQIARYQFDDLQVLHDRTRDLDTMEVTELLLSCLESGKVFYLIIDGLDECDEKECEEVILNLTHLRQSDTSTLKIYIASRPDIEGQLFSAGKPQYRISVTEEKVKPDMEVYIDVTLSRLLENGKLKLRDGRLIGTISQALRDGSDGMILWTRLFIEELCAQGSDKEISKALTQLPRGLAELYDQKLRRMMSKPNVESATDMLRFCAFLKRSLTLLEYEDLLGIKSEQESHQPENCPTDMIQVISNCCGLIFVDEEDSTVHYVHHSVKEHLLASKGHLPSTIDMAGVDQHLGILCLTYLNFNDFKRQLAKVREGSHTPIQPLQLGILPLSSVGRKVALEILSRGRHLRHLRSAEVERQIEEIFEVSKIPGLEHERQRSYPFLIYAQTYWIDHLRELNVPTDSKIWRLFCQCVEGSDIPARRPWDADQENDNQADVRRSGWLWVQQHRALLWYYAIHQTPTGDDELNSDILEEVTHRLGHDCRLREIIQSFLVESPLRLNKVTFCNYFLAVAARSRCEVCIEYLVQAGCCPNTRLSFIDETPLQAAAQLGHIQAVKILIQAKADINAAPARYHGLTALQAAAGGGHLEVLDALIQAGADINAAPAQESGRTALQAAAAGGQPEVVSALIKLNADINAAPGRNSGRTALQAAAEGGHIEIVNALIQAGADINANPAPQSGRTALEAAAKGGHLEVVNTLIKANAKVNATLIHGSGRTALQAAAEGGHLEVLDALIKANANINAAPANVSGRTALQAAAEAGHLQVVNRLLRETADVNAAPAEISGRTALQAAANGAHPEVMNALIQANADVNAAPGRLLGQTALDAAARNGHLEGVKILIQANFNVNMPSPAPEKRLGDDQTALQAAATNGHLEVVKALIEANADVNLVPRDSSSRSPLKEAEDWGYLEIAEILRQAGAEK